MINADFALILSLAGIADVYALVDSGKAISCGGADIRQSAHGGDKESGVGYYFQDRLKKSLAGQDARRGIYASLLKP